jgi:hypothetical protein
MSGQFPPPPGAPGTLGAPGTFGIDPQFAMNGALNPANTIGHETRRQNLRIIPSSSCRRVCDPPLAADDCGRRSIDSVSAELGGIVT